MLQSVVYCCLVGALLIPHASAFEELTTHPLTALERQGIQQKYRRVIESTDDSSPTVSIHSRRGDACMLLREYKQAVEEYRAMVKLQPDLDASHWRLGIALFFDGQPETAAAQFDKYHSFDDVDRENGIWRFLCHYRAFGAERAAKELLRYDKDDRQPFPVVYQLFDGSVTPEEALKQIPESLPASERDKRLFYTELYIGLLKTVQHDNAAARKALWNATSRQWPRTAGFGPNYMWHVGRLQFDELMKLEE
ncbi:MAG: hypothetical protein MK102_04985 [Fuerstiella sp.]|nr:hypothetical protein [Fuerstiella sp.]